MKEIVVVDDNEMFLKTLKDFAESISREFKCMAFFNPEDALRYVVKKKKSML